MRLFFFGLATLASAILTVSVVDIYPALVLGSMEGHEPAIEHSLKVFCPPLVILALWVGLIWAYQATRNSFPIVKAQD
jgi:hypothetical protein